MTKSRNYSFVLLFLILPFFFTCTLPETTTENPIVKTNHSPTALAGDDQYIHMGDTVILDGSGSEDLDNDPLTYLWELVTVPIGSTSTIVNEHQAIANFTLDLTGEYIIKLSVSDRFTTSLDELSIYVFDSGANIPPVAKLEIITLPPYYRYDIIQLDGSKSFDPDNSPNAISFTWEVIIKPDNSTHCSLNTVNATADFDPDVKGVYTIRLAADDGENSSNKDIDITINNTPPDLSIFSHIIVSSITVSTPLVVDGCSDLDSDLIYFEWKFIAVPAGSSLTNENINNRFSDSASFTPDKEGIYSLTITASDGEDMDMVNLTVYVTSDTTGVIEIKIE
jgi:hypothetical protein